MNEKNRPFYSKELWRNAYLLLKKRKNPISLQYSKEVITSHPDYPSLLSLIDFFDLGNLKYEAIEADASYINEFSYPLLAHIKHPGHQFLHIIHRPSDWDKEKQITQYWSGIVVSPTKNSTWENAENSRYLKKEKNNRVTALLFSVLALVCLLLSYIKSATLGSAVFGLLSLIGLIVSIFALSTELGFQSELIKQVCGTISSGGCEDVLKSKYAKSKIGITPADLSVLYFSTQFSFYLLSPFYAGLFSVVCLLSLMGIPVAAWSIYTQGRKLKKWCALCLGIVVVLIAQSVFPLTSTVRNWNITEIGAFFLLALTLILFYLPLKKLITQDVASRLKTAELRSWKSDPQVFAALLQGEQSVDITQWPNDILLGNPDALIQITVACNPYCGPCSKAHKFFDTLLEKYPEKLKMQLKFLLYPDDNTDHRTIAVKAMLKTKETIQDDSMLKEMLADWFEWANYERWTSKWKFDDDIDVSATLRQHGEWVQQSNITFTPTIFINGRRLPGRYLIEDLEILLQKFEEPTVLTPA